MSKKLDYKMFNFFEVIGSKRVFIELQLPQSMKIYNVFYFNLFWKALIDPLTNQVNKLSSLIIINNKQEWEVEDIFDAGSYWDEF